MSSIIIWTNYENPSGDLWVVADSRYTHPDNRIITDNGPKIFELPIICQNPSSRGFFENTYYFNKIGFAFAGSVTQLYVFIPMLLICYHIWLQLRKIYPLLKI